MRSCCNEAKGRFLSDQGLLIHRAPLTVQVRPASRLRLRLLPPSMLFRPVSEACPQPPPTGMTSIHPNGSKAVLYKFRYSHSGNSSKLESE